MIWLLLALLIVCSGCVSASETALFGLSRQAYYQFANSEGLLRRRVFMLMKHPRRVLLTLLITNTAVNVAIFALSFVAANRLHDQNPAVAALVSLGVLLAVIVFGEMLPKALALKSALRVAPWAGALTQLLHIVLSPLRLILGTLLVDPITRLLSPSSRVQSTVSTDELKLLVEHSASEGHINTTENDMLQAVVALADISVREVIMPRVDIHWLTLESTREEILALAEKTKRRRFPVCSKDIDNIHGILYVRDMVLNPDASIKSILRPVHYIPEQVNLLQLLRQFHGQQGHIAIVVDEYGGTAGLVTIEDVIQWIVGDIPDYEATQSTDVTTQIDENTYRLSGNLSVRVWADRFGVGEIDRHIDTVGGLVLSRLGRLPRTGDQIQIRNLTLTVESMHRRRVEYVLLTRNTNGQDSPGQEPPGGAA